MSHTGKRSAGLLMFRRCEGEIEVFLVHPGGPFFVHRDDGYWGIPKGLIEDGEELLAVGEREFAEETGRTVEACRSAEGMYSLGSIAQRGGKTVFGWAFEGNWPDGTPVQSNTFRLEWPRRSGRFIEVPEVDRGEFFPLSRARVKISEAQRPFLDRLLALIENAELAGW